MSFTTRSTSYPDLNSAHRGEFLAWINGQEAAGLRKALADGASPSALQAEIVADGWFAGRDWFSAGVLAYEIEHLCTGQFFLVRDGEADPIETPAAAARISAEISDTFEAVVVYATDDASALEVASLYDAGRIGIDNLTRRGVTVACVRQAGAL